MHNVPESAEPLLLGVDIGTSSVKTVVCEPGGRVVCQASAENTLRADAPGWAEQDPDQWWANTLTTIRACLDHPDVDARQIAAVGVTGMLPTLVLLGADGAPLRPSIQQNDARALAEIDQLAAVVGTEVFFARTGASLSQQSIGPRLLWLQTHEPDVWAQAQTLLGSYDYINFRLTGVLSVEQNWALESGLYDINQRQWSPDLLAAVHTSAARLPDVHAPHEVIGAVTDAAARETGLRAGTPVVAGSADHIGAALAAGVTEEGDLLVKIGSAGDILYCTGTPRLDPRLYIDYHDVPGKYLLNGCMATSGSLLRWYVQQFCPDVLAEARAAGSSAYVRLDARAAALPPGSERLVVLPYFLGEKTPLMDPYARGTMLGLTLFHTREHVYRAILEAVAYGFRHHVDVLREQGREPQRVLISEGGAASALWRQITADVLQRPVLYLRDNPGSALGAAFVAGVGAGVFTSWADIRRFVVVEGTTAPNPANAAIYDELYGVYREAYERLKPTFRRLAETAP